MGLTFLKDVDDGQRFCAQVVQKINDLDAQNHKNIKMLIKYGNDDNAVEELIAYTELSDIIEAQHQEEIDNIMTVKGQSKHSGNTCMQNEPWRHSSRQKRMSRMASGLSCASRSIPST